MVNLKMKNKKGWLRIVEAFIAVLLIMAVLLVMVSNQRSGITRQTEIESLGDNIMNFISRDEALISSALLNDTSEINQTIEKMIPPTVAFSTKICPYYEVCSLGEYMPKKYVYSTEILVPPNLTTSASGTKLKLFMWVK